MTSCTCKSGVTRVEDRCKQTQQMPVKTRLPLRLSKAISQFPQKVKGRNRNSLAFVVASTGLYRSQCHLVGRSVMFPIKNYPGKFISVLLSFSFPASLFSTLFSGVAFLCLPPFLLSSFSTYLFPLSHLILFHGSVLFLL